MYLSASVFILAFVTLHLVFRFIYADRMLIESRVVGIAKIKMGGSVDLYDDEQLRLPLSERIFIPLLNRLGKVVESYAPQRLVSGFTKKVNSSGMGVSPKQFLAWYAISGGGVFALSLLYGWAQFGNIFASIAVAPVGVLVGFMLPELILRQKTTARKEQIVRALPDVLDLLTVSVNAGLGFDSALMKVTEKMKGPLPTEMGQVLHEIKMGVTRRDALNALAERTGVGDLKSFVGTIIQADQLGVSISKVLKIQSENLRQKRKQRAEEMAMKAPIKMLFPLLVFIFPTLFIVLLGPAALQLMKNFTMP